MFQNPKSKIPKITKIPKIQNPRQNRKFGALGASHKELLHNDPKSKMQNPQNPAKKVWILDFGLGNVGFGIPAPESEIQSPKIRNPKSPKSKIPRQNRKFGALGASHKELLHNDPKSKIPKIQTLGILDFGDWGFWILILACEEVQGMYH